MSQPVRATAAALEVIARLRAAHGPVVFIQSGGCCDGTHPLCLHDHEIVLRPQDLRLGELGGVPFYIDADQYERWGRPRFEIDVAEGEAPGFSLEGSAGVHFVTRDQGERP
ncbi:MAG TPA: DUF779 domain-containing protein [Solirubrobacteraceae bacterium]|nr:DUF779 domain-containing protein [Solirubrobacteraceae bacterium]